MFSHRRASMNRAREYTYRRPLTPRELLPALGVGLATGLAAFYIASIFLQRTTLDPAARPRSLRPRPPAPLPR